MKKTYSLLVTLLVALVALSSCSRSNYAFNNKVPAYLGSEQAHTVATKPTPVKEAKKAEAAVTPATAGLTVVQPQAISAVASSATKAARPTLMQRALVKHVAKQLDKLSTRRQNMAHTEHTASKTGRAALIALVGLALIFLGGAIGNGVGGLLALIGVIAFLVGIVLVVVHLVSGD